MWCMSMSRKNYRFVRDTRFGTDVGSAVRPRHAGDSWFDRARLALSNQLSATSWLSGLTSRATARRGTKPPRFWHSPCKRKPPRMCLSGCSLLVDDLKAAVALLSSMVVETSFQRSQTIVFDVPCMHHGAWVGPCMPRLTLADVWRRQPESHESFELACRNAAGRCSTSVSMCSTPAVQRKQRRSDAEGRECSSPRTHRSAPAAFWTLWSDASGHGRPIPPTCGLF